MSTRRENLAVKDKVTVQFKATGDAPALKQSKFKITGSDRFSVLIEFIRKQVQRDSVFVFCNGAFSPCPDEIISDLYKCFSVDGVLVLNYATQMAWG